jgi:hypothetical protein
MPFWVELAVCCSNDKDDERAITIVVEFPSKDVFDEYEQDYQFRPLVEPINEFLSKTYTGKGYYVEDTIDTSNYLTSRPDKVHVYAKEIPHCDA